MIDRIQSARVDELKSKVEDGIRRHPLAVTGAAALGGFCVGLLATRLLSEPAAPRSRVSELSDAVADAVRRVIPKDLLPG